MSTGDVIDRAVRLYRRNFTSLLAIVAVPTLVGLIASLMFRYGMLSLDQEYAGSAEASGEAALMLILGVIGYPIWVLTLVATLAGLARVVGDNLMMSEPITFKAWAGAVRNRLGDSIKLGLLVIGLLFVSMFAVFIALMIIGIFVQIVVLMVTALRLPEWGLIATAVVLALAALSGLFVVASAILARFVFLPQVVMIEGETPGIATGRARRLGAGNGFRVGAILIFSYFFMLSLFAALTLPLLVALYFLGIPTEELFTNPLLSVVYTAFQDISSLLALPIWSISFTLLYFDNRVRKEAYDVELLARDVAPGLQWQPTVRESAFGYQMAAVSAHDRAYVQTSPLGLAGRIHYQGDLGRAERPHPAAAAAPPSGEGTGSLAHTGESAMISDGSGSETPGPPIATCTSCGTRTWERTRFCSECGHQLNGQSRG
jgi:hypothetical protein